VKPFVNGLSFTLLRSPPTLKGIAVFERFKRLKTNMKGATAVEYGLILALVVLAMMAALSSFATSANNMWYRVANEVNNN
jgi:pilus assembly protein Flp/PilA